MERLEGHNIMTTIIVAAKQGMPADPIRMAFYMQIVEAFRLLNWAGFRDVEHMDPAYQKVLEVKGLSFTQGAPLEYGKYKHDRNFAITWGNFNGSKLFELPDKYINYMLTEKKEFMDRFPETKAQFIMEMQYRDYNPSESVKWDKKG